MNLFKLAQHFDQLPYTHALKPFAYGAMLAFAPGFHMVPAQPLLIHEPLSWAPGLVVMHFVTEPQHLADHFGLVLGIFLVGCWLGHPLCTPIKGRECTKWLRVAHAFGFTMTCITCSLSVCTPKLISSLRWSLSMNAFLIAPFFRSTSTSSG